MVLLKIGQAYKIKAFFIDMKTPKNTIIYQIRFVGSHFFLFMNKYTILIFQAIL